MAFKRKDLTVNLLPHVPPGDAGGGSDGGEGCDGGCIVRSYFICVDGTRQAPCGITLGFRSGMSREGEGADPEQLAVLQEQLKKQIAEIEKLQKEQAEKGKK